MKPTKFILKYKILILLMLFGLGIFLIGCDSNVNQINDGDIEYELALTVNDSQFGTVAGGGKYKAGETVTVTATLTAGYTFEGWYDEAGKISDNLEYILTMPAQNLTLTGKFGGDTGNINLCAALSETAVIGDLQTMQITQIKSTPDSVPHFATVERDGDKAYCYTYYSDAQEPDKEYYFERISGEISRFYFRYLLEEGVWHKYLVSQNYHISYDFNFDVFSILGKLNFEDFTQNGEYYDLKPSAYEAFSQITEWSFSSDFERVRLLLQNGKITKLIFDCKNISADEVTSYTYIISRDDEIAVTLPQDYVDDAAKYEDYLKIAHTVSRIYSYQTTNFTMDTIAIYDTRTTIGKLWAVDKFNFGMIAYSDQDEVILGQVYTKQNGIYDVFTFDETDKVWTKTYSETENTLETVYGFEWSQFDYSSILYYLMTQHVQAVVSEDSMTYSYEQTYYYYYMKIFHLGSTEMFIPAISE